MEIFKLYYYYYFEKEKEKKDTNGIVFMVVESCWLHCAAQVFTTVAFESVAVNVRRSQRHFFVGSTSGALLQFALVCRSRCKKQHIL